MGGNKRHLRGTAGLGNWGIGELSCLKIRFQNPSMSLAIRRLHNEEILKDLGEKAHTVLPSNLLEVSSEE